MESQLTLIYALSFLSVALAFAFAAYLYLWVKKQQMGNAKIMEVSALIKAGANTFMRMKVLAPALIRADTSMILALPICCFLTHRYR